MKKLLSLAVALALALSLLPMAFASTQERYDERYQLNPDFPGTYLGTNKDGVHTFEITITDDGTRYPLPLTYMGENLSTHIDNDISSPRLPFSVDFTDGGGGRFYGIRPGSGTLTYYNGYQSILVKPVEIAIIRITVVSASGTTVNPDTAVTNPSTTTTNPGTAVTDPGAAPTANPGTAAANPSTTSGEIPSGGNEFPKLSKDEICDLLGGSASASLSTEDLYDVAPNCSAPYSIGKVKQSVLQEAADRLNALRRIAGVSQVTLDAGLCEQGQYGAVLLGTLGSITHEPKKPSDMDNSFYQIGRKACNDSNISSSWDLLWSVDSMMDDTDMFNYSSLSHRRWQLNPTMGKIGFGVVKDGKKTVIGGSSAASGLTYTASATVEMSHDRSGLGCDYDFISWPASGNFPIGEYFHPAGSMWSITLNHEKYSAPNKYLVKIKIVRQNDKAEWYIDKDSNAKDESYYFNVDTTGYGVRNCIIFHPSNYVGDYGSSLDGETYTVTVSGLFNKDSTPAGDLVYSVSFFNPETYRSSAAETTPNPVPDSASDSPSSWAREQVSQAIAAGLVPSALQSRYTQSITRQEFCALANVVYQKVKGDVTPTVTFSDTSDPAVLKMAAVGVVNGVGGSRFDPSGSLTREQAAAMLYRLAAAAGKPLPDVSASFADKAAVSSWASKEVGAVQAAGIMNGVGNNRFDPKGSYTIEQSILTMLRIYQYLNR